MNCKNCNTEFTGIKRKFCSKHCCKKWHGKQRYKGWDNSARKCKRCNKEYVPNKVHQKYCSRSCQLVAQYKRQCKKITYLCTYCGSPHHPQRINDKRKKTNNHFCSRSCSSTYIHNGGIVKEKWEEEKARRKREFNKNKVEVKCCPITGDLLTHKGKYSEEGSKIMNNFRSLMRLAKQYYQQKKHIKHCEVCETEFIKCFGDFTSSRFCSDKCKEVVAKKVRRVSGYKAKIKRRKKTKNIYITAIDPIDILMRDRYICQECGKKTKRTLRGESHDDAPEVDHILPISQGGEHTYYNLQCLCRQCNANKGGKMTLASYKKRKELQCA